MAHKSKSNVVESSNLVKCFLKVRLRHGKWRCLGKDQITRPFKLDTPDNGPNYKAFAI